jgi:predicted Zn-dependent protease
MRAFLNLSSLQEKISMNTALRMLAVVIAVCTFLSSCTVDKQIVAPDESREYAVARPDNKYYYYMEAQLARQNGDLDKAIYYQKKATELEPDSFYLKKELALLFSQ